VLLMGDNDNNEIETLTTKAYNTSVWANKNNIIKVIRKIKDLKLYKENTLLYLEYYGSKFTERKHKKTYLYEVQDYYGHDHLGDVYISDDFVFIETKDNFVFPLFKIIQPKDKKQQKPKAILVKKLDYFIEGGNNGQ